MQAQGKMGKDSSSVPEPTLSDPLLRSIKMAARKPSKPVPAKAIPAKSTPVAVTPVRNTVVPPKPAAVTTPARKPVVITREAIAIRAYEIWRSGKGGSEHQNWVQAEQELKGL
jgi:hypothetical protein